MIQENESPKYRKQKESKVSKSKKKSNHKHQYEECLVQCQFDFLGDNNIFTSLRSYCTICGKLGDRFDEDKSIVKDYVKRIDTSVGRGYQVMKSEELYEKYHDKMPVFFLEDIFKEKYVDVEQLMLSDESNGE